jgi:putative Mg2+ transporter-C (MgtC) family protein
MFGQIFGTLDLLLAVEIAAQILLALVLGGLVGYERERRRIPAGVRTFMLVSTGSCIFTILSYRAFPGGDSARVAAQVVSGIGFLGAGLVLRRKGTIYGLTSAAGIWSIAAVGMAVGAGKYFVGIFGAVAIFVVLGLIRQWFKAEVPRATRRTLNTALRQVQGQLSSMGRLAGRAVTRSVRAVLEDDHELAQDVIEEDRELDGLRDQVEDECLTILRTHHPQQIQLRTVIAASHIASSLERIGDYAKEIAQIRLQVEHELLPASLEKVPPMAARVCDLLGEALIAFRDDDIAAAEKVIERMTDIDWQYENIVQDVTERMSEKKTRHFGRGAYLLEVVGLLRRSGERVASIAKRIIFVRTGALAELDGEE